MIGNSAFKSLRYSVLSYLNRPFTGLFLQAVLLLWGIYYGVYGTYRVLAISQVKAQTVNELTQINQSLKDKYAVMQELNSSNEELAHYLTKLQEYVPEYPNPQGFVVDLVTVSTSAGFKINRFQINQKTLESVSYTLSLEGFMRDVETLVKNIEEMSRLTEVESVSIAEIDGRVSVNLKVKAYFKRI